MEKARKQTKEVPGTKPDQPAPPLPKRGPVEIIREGDCSASIWARDYVVQGQPKRFYSVTLERSYKDRDGAWKYTKSLDPESLGKVVSLCQQASERIRDLQQDAAPVGSASR
jgi:hypothetical protein